MIHQIKEKILLALTVMFTCPVSFGIFTSCGTEVGNGHAGSSIGELLKNKEDDGRKGGGTTTANGQVPNSEGDKNESAPTNSQSSPGGIQAESQVLSVLLNSCAAPFKDQNGNGRRVLSGHKSTDQSIVQVEVESLNTAGTPERLWNLSLVENASRKEYVANGLPGQEVEISSAVTGKLISTDKCGTVSQESDVKISGGGEELFVKKSVDVTSSENIKTSLAWYIQTSGGRTFLQRIEIKRGGFEVILNAP